MDWMNSVVNMGAWFANNVTTYQNASSSAVRPRYAYPLRYTCPLIGEKVRDDCSGFVVACLILAKVLPSGSSYAAKDFASVSGSLANYLKMAGFQPMTFQASLFKPVDIYAHNAHVEICAGPNMQYGWGNVHYGNMPCKTGYSGSWTGGKSYITIWRLNGVSDFPSYSGEFLYTNGGASFQGSSWGKPQNMGVYNMNGNLKPITNGVIVGTHINQKK